MAHLSVSLGLILQVVVFWFILWVVVSWSILQVVAIWPVLQVVVFRSVLILLVTFLHIIQTKEIDICSHFTNGETGDRWD